MNNAAGVGRSEHYREVGFIVSRAAPRELLNMSFGGSGLSVLQRLVHSLLGMNSSAAVGGCEGHWEFGFMATRAVSGNYLIHSRAPH